MDFPFGTEDRYEGLFSAGKKNYEVYNYVDSSYLQIAIRYGIVLLALVCVFVWCGTFKGT